MLNCSYRKEIDGVKQDGVFRVKVVFHLENSYFKQKYSLILRRPR